MNTAALKAIIDQRVTDITAIDGITPVILGGLIKDMVDALKPYKLLLFRLEISSGELTPVFLINDFSEEVITMTRPVGTNGVIRVAIPSAPFGLTTHLVTPTIMAGSVLYRLVPTLTTSASFDINMQQWDGTQTSTPNIFNQLIEIRLYS